MTDTEHMQHAHYLDDKIVLTSYTLNDDRATVTFEPENPKAYPPTVRVTVELPGNLKVSKVMTLDRVRYRHRKMYAAGWRTESEHRDDADGHGYYR